MSSSSSVLSFVLYMIDIIQELYGMSKEIYPQLWYSRAAQGRDGLSGGYSGTGKIYP